MKFPVIRESYFINISILLFSLFIGYFSLLFGIAHFIEAIDGNNLNIPYSESIMGWIMVISLCVMGIVFLLIAYASIKGILYKIKLNKKRTFKSN